MNLLKLSILFIFIMAMMGCGSDDDCTKISRIPQYYKVNNIEYPYNQYVRTDCDYIAPLEAVEIDPVILPNFNYVLANLSYNPNTGNNTSKLLATIIVINNNDFRADGFAYIQFTSDQQNFGVPVFPADNIIACPSIEANSSCTITYVREKSLTEGTLTNVGIADITYYLTNE